MAYLTLNFLGQFHAAYNDRVLSGFESNKVRALLAYLAVETDRAHPREQLATLLWPGYREESARGNLRHTLYKLRHLLTNVSRGNGAATEWFASSRASISFTPLAPYQLDVREFTTLLQQCASHPHSQLAQCEVCLARLQQAVEQYRGDFLAGLAIDDSTPFEEWRRLKQEALHRQALTALEQLAAAHEARGNHELAHAYALRQLEMEPWREEAHRQIMRSLAHSGQPQAALAQFNACCKILATEFGSEPAAATLALYAQIRAGAFPVTSVLSVTTGERAVLPLCAPSPAPIPIPANALAPLTAFVGRRGELAAILRQLHDPTARLLTLVGAGGMGKTRLALEIARQLSAVHSTTAVGNPSAMHTMEDLPRFADGIIFVELAPLRTDSEIVTAIITALGVNTQGKDPRDYLLQFLRDKRLLLLLDNCEHLPDVADLIVDLLQGAPALRVLATSRARLKVQGEHLYPVQGMRYSLDLTLATADEASAVRLLVQSVRRVQPTFTLTEANLPAALRICQLVDGMPLGLELAATWADLLPLTTIVQEIEQNLDFLAADWRNAPERQRSLRAVFNWSWQMLSADEQQVFGHLAIFRGGFTHAAAQAVTGASLRVLTNLWHKSLLVARPDEGRYELHELLRQFAAQQVTADPTELAALAQRHGHFYLAFVTDRQERLMGREPRSAVGELQADLDNIRQAWQWAVAQGESQMLGQCTLGIAKLYDHLGLLAERNQLFALAIAALQQPVAVGTDVATARARQQILARFLALQASGLVAQGRFDEVLALAQQAIALGAANDGWEGESLGYMAWGQSCYRQGKLAEAQQHVGQALALARRYRPLSPALTLLNDVEATALIWLAGIAKDEGALPQAYDYLMAALQLSQALGNVRGETRVRFNLASLAWIRRDYQTARQAYEQALAMAQQVGDPLAAGICYLELGEVLRMQGEYGGAYQALAQAQAIFTQIGDFIQNAYAITCLGCLCVYLGDFTAAGHLHQQAAAYSNSLDSAIVKYQGLLLQALFAHISGEQRTAQTVAYNCWQVAQATKSSSRQARALVLLGHAAAALQDHPAAATAYEQAAILFDAMGYRTSAAAEARAGLAALALQQGYPAQALALVTEFLPHLLDDSVVVGVDEPFYTYLTGYQVLVANEDSRAQALLQHGYNRLLTYADQIADPALRHSFLHNVPVHYALQQAYLTTR